MEWGFELWDKFDLMTNNAQRSLDQNEKVIHFFKERCSVERDYAKSLKKLVNNFNQKKKEEDDYTVSQGLTKSFQELWDLAGQHETIADRISEDIVKALHALNVESKHNRKKSIQEGGKLQSQLQIQIEKLDKAKKRYEKAFSDAEKSSETYKKNEQDMNLAKIEIDKSRLVMEGKQQCSEECKKDYAYEVEVTNKYQQEHYNKLMPEVFMQLQVQEETRVSKVKDSIGSMASIETDVVPIVNRCIEGLHAAADLIDPKGDLQLAIDKHKTGFPIPSDIAFVDLSNNNTSNNNGHNNSYSSNNNSYNNPFNSSGGKTSVNKNIRKRQGLFGIFGTKSDEVKEDFSHLPPNQQRKQLNSKIERIKSDLTKLKGEREALNKMREVYANNTNLGDPATIDKQLHENSSTINKLEPELNKNKSYLENMGRNFDSPGTSPALGRRGDDDASSLNSRVSVISINSQQNEQQQQPQHQPQLPQKPQQQKPQQQKPQHQQQQQYNERQDSFFDDDEFDTEFDTQGARCTALYDYEGTGDDGSLAMVKGEMFVVILDEVDGWMQVKKEQNGDVGYVPSSYVQIV